MPCFIILEKKAISGSASGFCLLFDNNLENRVGYQFVSFFLNASIGFQNTHNL
jgi:hypothetical protein